MLVCINENMYMPMHVFVYKRIYIYILCILYILVHNVYSVRTFLTIRGMPGSTCRLASYIPFHLINSSNVILYNLAICNSVSFCANICILSSKSCSSPHLQYRTVLSADIVHIRVLSKSRDKIGAE